MLQLQEGIDTPIRVVFQQVDVFDCWVWFEFYQVRWNLLDSFHLDAMP